MAFPVYPPPPRRPRAFTLIELLVVVAIIGLLATIALNNYREARDRAEVAHCKGNLKALGTALSSYKLDYGAYPPADGSAGRAPSPDRTDPGNGPAAGGSWDGAPWCIVELHYLESPDALYCPTLRRKYGKQAESFRYAYNYAALDSGGSRGGASDIENADGDHWLCRCLWVPAEASFHPRARYVYPHGDDADAARDLRRDTMENVLFRDLRVVLRNGKSDFLTAHAVRR